MIKKLRVAVDHGNRNMKTCHFIFTSGLNVLDKKPTRGEQYLQYEGKYYTLIEHRIPYQRDKTLDFRFYLLNSIRERGIDTKTSYTVFIGGGAVLLKQFLEQSDRQGKYLFIEDLKANARGYDLLYRAYENGK